MSNFSQLLYEKIERTGRIRVGEMVALAEDFDLRHTPEDNDLARLFQAIAKTADPLF